MRSTHLLSATLLACAAGGLAAADLDVQFHGFVSQGYYLTTNGNNYAGDSARPVGANAFSGGGTSNFTEVGLNVTAKPYDRVTVGMQIAAQDFGRYFGMKPQIDWAYGKYELPKKISWLDANVALGRVKFGHALYNDYRDLDMTRTAVFLPQSNYAPSFRDLYLAGNGAQINLSANAGKGGSFDFSGFVGTTTFDSQNGPLVDNFSGSYSSLDLTGFGGPALTNSVHSDSLTVKRLEEINLTWNTPQDGLRFKGSLLAAQNFVAAGTWTVQDTSLPLATLPQVGSAYSYATEIPSYFQIVASAEYQRGDWIFAAEYSHDSFSYTSTSTAIDSSITAPGMAKLAAEGHTEFDSGYISATYQINPKWSVYGCICATNYGDGEHYSDTNNHRGYCTAVRYDVTQHFLLKAEFERNSGSFLLSGKDNPNGEEKYWNLFAVKGTFDF